MPAGTLTGPPGLQSPAVFPFPPTVTGGLPGSSAPYLIGTQDTGGTTLTMAIKPRVTTTTGDAIVVVVNSRGSDSPPASCVDTQNNTYSMLVSDPASAGGKPGGMFVATNTTQLTPSDTITVTYQSSSEGQGVAAGIPSAAVPGGPYLTYDMVSAVPGGGVASLTATATYSTSYPCVALASIACSQQTLPQLPADWTILGQCWRSSTNRIILAYKSFPKLAAGQNVLPVLLANGSSELLQYVTLIPETRFATPQLPPPVPGMLSPAAFSYVPSEFPNDAPVAGMPYLIGNSAKRTGPSGSNYTVQVQAATGRGDAVVIYAMSQSSGAILGGCTDTQGNTYTPTLVQPGSFAFVCNQYTAVNTTPLGLTDSVTVNFATQGGSTVIIMVGVPAAGVGSTGFMVPDQLARNVGSQGLVTLTTPTVSTAPQMALAAICTSQTQTPVNWPQPWTCLTSISNSSTNVTSVGYLPVSSLTTAHVQWLLSAGFGTAAAFLCTFMPETRFAPSRIPDTPPGRRSPAAWQFQPGFNTPRTGFYLTSFDTGHGTDTATVTTGARVTSGDTGLGTDSASVNTGAQASSADTGHGVNTATVEAQVTVADTGLGVDNGTVNTGAVVSSGDTGTGADVGTVTIAYHPQIQGAATYRGLGGSAKPGGTSGSGG